MSSDRGWPASGYAGALADGGPLVHVQFTFSRALWRIGPAWSVLAGAFVVGWTPESLGGVLRLVAAITLGDLAWGSLRQILPSGPVGYDFPGTSLLPLPYATPRAPLARFLNRLEGGAGRPPASVWQPLVASLVLVAVLSVLMGPIASVLSACVLLLVILVWLLVANRGDFPALSLALLDVAAPWLVGMSWAGLGAFVSRDALRPLALMAGFVLLQWGVYRAARSATSSAAGAWAGQAAVLLALIAARQINACALVATLFLLPSWRLLRQDKAGLIRALPWWWAALMVAALALAQTYHTLS